MYKHYITLILLFILSYSFSFAQTNDSLQFEIHYTKAIDFLKKTCDSVESSILLMTNSGNIDDLQKAKIDFVKSKIFVLYDIDPQIDNKSYGSEEFINDKSLFEQAQTYIDNGNSDKGIPLIFKFLKTIDENSDSATFANIYLVEAYRQKLEFKKGLEIIYTLLENKNISSKNKAYAYNRLAAIYNECGNWVESKSDSVIKYSQRCIDISRQNGFKDYLATSQNELAFIYLMKGKKQLALDYCSKSVSNFTDLKMYPQSINSSINLARIYSALGNPEKAAGILNKAIEFSDVNENVSLFMRVYLFLAKMNSEIGDYKKAYDYLSIARSLQSNNYYYKMKMQVNEMSAKYDLQLKESRIIAEKQKNKIYLQQKRFFLIIAIISLLLLIILLILFRFKNQSYKALLIQNLQSQKLSKKLEASIKADINIVSVNEEQAPGEEKYFQLGQQLEKYIVREKPYLFNELHIDDICKQLNTNRTYLSKAISLYFEKDFNDLICDYRIGTARELLTNPKNDHISIEGIGKMSGFNSVSVFHKRFKSTTGLTPSYYRNNRNFP